MVDENMANAARVHAVESGTTQDGRTLIAFGGGGPVHGYRVAEKLGMRRMLVPAGAGVGSAIGFLRAPIAYEVVRSLYQRLGRFDREAVNALLAAMEHEAATLVAAGSFGRPTTTTGIAYMRYVGQGHEIPVSLPRWPLTLTDVASLRRDYDAAYARFYDRPVPGSDVEIMSFAVRVATDATPGPAMRHETATNSAPRVQQLRDTAKGTVAEWRVVDRASLTEGTNLAGPAIVAEDETSTLVGPGWTASLQPDRSLLLTRES
jgi:N-methylhydantoinase A